MYETEFVRGMIIDPAWVDRLECSNFCVPSSELFYMGPSSFWDYDKYDEDEDGNLSLRSAPNTAQLKRKKFEIWI